MKTTAHKFKANPQGAYRYADLGGTVTITHTHYPDRVFELTAKAKMPKAINKSLKDATLYGYGSHLMKITDSAIEFKSLDYEGILSSPFVSDTQSEKDEVMKELAIGLIESSSINPDIRDSMVKAINDGMIDE